MTDIPEVEQIVIELKKIVSFKKVTLEGDIVLIVTDKPRTFIYAIIQDIVRDNAKKGEWWHVTMHALTVPPQKMVWTLRTPQLSGEEIFTMGGDKRFMQAVDFEKAGPKPQPAREKTPLKSQKKVALRVVK